MAKLLTLFAFTTLALALASGQIGLGRGGGSAVSASGGAEAANSLKAGDRSLDSQKGLLQRKNDKQARLARRVARKERKRKRLAARKAEKLKAMNSVDFETYDKAQKFHNLQAAANKDSHNKFGLQVFSENKNKENAAIKANEGAREESATRLAAKEAVDAQAFNNVEALDEGEAHAADELNAADASEDSLNAREESRNERQSFIDTQNHERVSGLGQSQQQVNSGFFGSDDFFGNSNSFGGFFRR